MPPCKYYEDLLPLYVSGDLDSTETDRVRKHLTKCSACQAYYLDMQKLTEILRPEPIEIDPAYGAELVVALNNRLQARDIRTRRWRPMLVYASALLVIIAAVFLIKNRFIGTENPVIPPQEDYYSTLLKIGYFNEMPLPELSDENGQLTLDNINWVSDIASKVLAGSQVLPVEDFIEVTAPLAESDFESIYQNLAAQPF